MDKNYFNKNLNIGCGVIILFFIVLIILAFVYSGILMWIWNITIPVIFGLPTISFWQALGIYIISNILFKGTSSIRQGDLYDKNRKR